MMKTRHAAALALVGWYLMVAPAAEHQPQLTQSLSNEDLMACTARAFTHTDRPANPRCPIRDSDAPFNRWITIGSYDTAAGCLAGRLMLRDKGDLRLHDSKCIATDDSRLKGN
jgi:hypothetical protein